MTRLLRILSDSLFYKASVSNFHEFKPFTKFFRFYLLLFLICLLSLHIFFLFAQSPGVEMVQLQFLQPFTLVNLIAILHLVIFLVDFQGLAYFIVVSSVELVGYGFNLGHVGCIVGDELVEQIPFIFILFVPIFSLLMNFDSKIGILLATILVIQFFSVVVAVFLLKFRSDVVLNFIVDHFHE